MGVVADAIALQMLAEQDMLCDVAELRADCLSAAQLDEALHIPLRRARLLTLRHEDEGGAVSMPEDQRRSLALRLLPAVDALDWEIAKLPGAEDLVAAAKAAGVCVVASAHYFEHTPPLEEMLGLARRAKEAGADIVKIAFTPRSQEDVQVGADFLQRCDMPAAVMGMGSLGVESRKLYTRLGSALLYGYLGDRPAVSGQMSVEECVKGMTIDQ